MVGTSTRTTTALPGSFSGARPEGRDGRYGGITRMDRPSGFSGARPEGRDGRRASTRGARPSMKRFSGARPEGRDGRRTFFIDHRPNTALQWGPTRGPGWFAVAWGAGVRDRWASVGPDPRAGMVGFRGVPWPISLDMLQWGPTRGPGWSTRNSVDGRRMHQRASVGPDPRAGMVGWDRSGPPDHAGASVGPDPRAGMVGRCTAACPAPSLCFSGARPEGRDGRGGLPPDEVRHLFASVGPDPRAGMVGCCGASARSTAPGFSGARPEGRDGR